MLDYILDKIRTTETFKDPYEHLIIDNFIPEDDYKILAEEIKGPVHALSMQTHTPDEWEQNGKVVLDSPLCIGNEKVI